MARLPSTRAGQTPFNQLDHFPLSELVALKVVAHKHEERQALTAQAHVTASSWQEASELGITMPKS